MYNKINLKIYGVVTVWTKWQIIIPKQSREDIKIEKDGEYDIILVDRKGFWIWRKAGKAEYLQDFQIEDCGKIKIGERYQFVIPSFIRKELGIKEGDNLVVVWKSNDGIGFMKNDSIDSLFEYIKKSMNYK